MRSWCLQSARAEQGNGEPGIEQGSWCRAELAPGSGDCPGEGGTEVPLVCLTAGLQAWLKFRVAKGPQDTQDHI